MNKVIIYTAIIGGYDLLPKIREEEGIEYYCYTDVIPEDSNGWNCIYIPSFFKDNKLMIGYLKINPHLLFGSEVVAVWIDSNTDTVELTSTQIFLFLKDHPIATFSHRLRKTVFGELAIIAEYNLDNRNKVMKWESELKSMGFPDDKGLGEHGLLIRDLRNPKVRNLNDTWWRFLLIGSRRDQLSFMPALWYLNLEVKHIHYEDKDSKRTEFLKYPFREHSNPAKRTIENKSPSFQPEDYSAFCWTELHPTETGNKGKEFYLADSERWTLQTLEGIRALNHLVHSHNISVRENYCYLEKETISRYSTPDLRYAWKREFLRKAVLPSQRGIEIGFGHGYSAAIMLGYNPLLSLIAIEPAPDQLSYDCEKELIRQYDRRLEVYYGKVDKALEELSQKLPLEKIEFVHYNSSLLEGINEFWMLMEWYLCKALVGCRLILSEFSKEIATVVKFIQLSGMLDQLNPGMADVADNKQFIKVRTITLEECKQLRSLYNDRRTDYQEHVVATMINEKLNRVIDHNAHITKELEALSYHYQELKKYTNKLENPYLYLKIKIKRLLEHFKAS
jgi:hypothetical protein